MTKASCDKCHQLAWVNDCTLRGEHIGRFCANCFDTIKHDAPQRNRTNIDSGKNHNNPGFDNVIRAMEEDH